MKKIFAILLSLALMLSLAVPAMAADADLTGHTYKAYQIFSGTQATEDDELGNIAWGNGVNGAALLSALQADTTFGDTFNACKDAADVAEVMSGWDNGSDEAKAFAKLAYANKTGEGVACVNGETSLNAGYYLVVDVTSFGADDVNTVYNLALLQLTNKDTFVIANKTSVPSVVKKVDDENDSVADDPNTNDVDEGEDGKDWQDSADHDIGDHVPFQLTATLADNVSTYSSYKIVFHDTLSAGLTYDENAVVKFGDTDVTEYFTINCNGGTLTISCNNVKAFNATNNSVITVEYTATLNTGAVIGAAGNPNVVYLEYSNNPNWTPGTGDGPEDSPTGKTPVDKVIVFTYKVVANKVDENGNELKGAGFKLFKQTGIDENGKAVWAQIGDELTGDEMTTFEWKGLDDGNYKLEESKTPAGYNTIAPIEFTISAKHDLDSDNPQLTELTGGDKFTGEITTEGAYTGELTTDVENNKGTTLPETGGMGTTIFYAVGGVMVAAAAILLITKKRMSAEG